jgi:hypothetical protein
MGRSVNARPPADERESPEDQKPDEKREQPSFRPSKQDPFYLGLRDDLRKARRTARRNIDNARRRERRAADPDHRDKCRAQSHGLSLQDYRAMRERQKNVCGICKTPGKPLCVDHCHATGKVRGLLCRDCNLGLGNYKDNPVFTRAATAYLEAARRDDGNQRSSAGDGARFDLTIACSAGAGAECGRKPESRSTAAVFVDLELQIYRPGGRRREISRESPEKFRAGHMSASSLPPELPLDSAPWAEALIGGQAVVEPAGRPQEAPGTDEPAAGHSGLPLTSRTRSKRRSR